MINLFKTQLGRLRLMGYVEGTSLLLLLFITMPLKYSFNYPMPNKVVGLIHGLFFIMYVYAVVQIKIDQGWNLKKMLLALLASIIPFGTFWADKKLFLPTEKE